MTGSPTSTTRAAGEIDAVDFDGGFVNDVTVTRRAAYFTDSLKPLIYVYDRRTGATKTLPISGDLVYEAGFNANGIAATPDGRRLIIVQSNTGELFTANPRTGVDAADRRARRHQRRRHPAARQAALRGPQPAQPDRRAAAARPALAGDAEDELTDPDFDIPTTIARHGKRLYVVNARFGQESPTTTYDVVQVG